MQFVMTNRCDRVARMRLLATITALIIAVTVGSGAAAAQTPAGSTPVADPCQELAGEATPAGATTDQATMGRGTGAASPAASPAAEVAAFDLAFIDLMAIHHEGAIVMSEIALTRAEHPEIRSLAQYIILTQRAEQEQLATWRDEWYPGAPRADMAALMSVLDQAMAEIGMPAGSGGMGMMDPQADAQNLCAAAPPFDLAFIDAMTAHHDGAIMMAEVALRHAEQAGLKVFAQDVIEAQRAEVAQMQLWREQWYGAGTPTTLPSTS